MKNLKAKDVIDAFNNIIIEGIKKQWDEYINNIINKKLNGNDSQKKIYQKYNQFITILDQLSLAKEDQKKEIIEKMQSFLQDELQNRYNIPLDPLEFAMTGSAGVGVGVFMSTLHSFRFVENTLINIGK